MVTHRKPPFYRMCNDATQRRLPIFAVLFLNLFIDLTTIDGHVLPRPLATSTVTTFTTSTSIPSTTSISSTTTTTGSTAGERNFSTAGSNTAGTSATPSLPSRSVPFDLSTNIAPFGAHTSATNFSTESNVRANQHTGTVPYGEVEVNNTAGGGRVLVVVPDNFAIGQLRQGFRNFVTLLQSNRPPVPSDRIDQNGTLLDSLIQFRPWRGKCC